MNNLLQLHNEMICVDREIYFGLFVDALADGIHSR